MQRALRQHLGHSSAGLARPGVTEARRCRRLPPRPGEWHRGRVAWTRGLLRAGLVLALAWRATAALPAPPAEGRWEGMVAIPGAPMPLVIDLQSDDNRTWIGSFILPGRGVKGAPMESLVVNEQGVHFGLGAVFAGAPDIGPGEVRLRWVGDRLSGEFLQGGHRAPLTLSRSGDAQVDRPAPTRPPSPEMAGTWRGRYELGGYARDVTVTLSPQDGAAPAGEIVIVGKRRSVLTIDRVHQGREFITLESSQAGVRIEGRWSGRPGRIDGHFLQGPFEATLVLHQQDATGPAASGLKP